MTKEKTIHIVIIFMFCALISSCINTIENSLTASPHFRQGLVGQYKSIRANQRKRKAYQIKHRRGVGLQNSIRIYPRLARLLFWQPQRYLSPSRSRVSDGNTCSDTRSQ